MTDYTPVHVGTVTKYVVVESFDITPADLGVRAYEIAKGAMIKETCFGLVINGKEEEVDRIITRTAEDRSRPYLCQRPRVSRRAIPAAAGQTLAVHARDTTAWRAR